MQVLSIDSTTERLSVIISKDGKVVSKISRVSEQNFMKKIIGDIDSAVKKAGTDIRDIDAFGVNLGPGDFTGTRIGISVIKTMSFILDRPGYGIASPDVLAVGIALSNLNTLRKNIIKNKRALVVTCMDVKKGEIYYTIYDITESGIPDLKSAAAISLDSGRYMIKRIDSFLVSSYSFKEHLLESSRSICSGNSKIVIMGGDAVVRYGKVFRDLAKESGDYLVYKKGIFPLPESLDMCVNHCIKTGRASGNMNPVYVREFIPFGKIRSSFKEERGND